MDLIPSIDLMSVRQKPDVTELRHSHYHRCQLAMWFNYRNVKLLSYDIRKNLMAENLKTTVRRWVQASGYTIAKTGVTLSTGYTIDGICRKDEWQLLSIQVCSHKTFKRLVKHGIDDATRIELSSAMVNSGELSANGNTLHSALVLLVDRDDFEMHVFNVTVEPELIEVVDQLQHQAMESEAPPINDKGYWCNWCDYKTFCDKNELASVSCRTCANASIQGGEFSCDKGTSTCGQHLYHPALMTYAGYDYRSADPRGIIEYDGFCNVTETGPRKDGAANMTSRELFLAAGANDLQDDATLQAVLEVFDGRLKEANAIT